jgi:hypothetical protein
VLDSNTMVVTSQAQGAHAYQAGQAGQTDGASGCSSVFSTIGLAGGCIIFGMVLGSYTSQLFGKRKLASAFGSGATPTPGGVGAFDMVHAVGSKAGGGASGSDNGNFASWGDGSGLGHPAQQPVI